jgi:hypothetical protein
VTALTGASRNTRVRGPAREPGDAAASRALRRAGALAVVTVMVTFTACARLPAILFPRPEPPIATPAPPPRTPAPAKEAPAAPAPAAPAPATPAPARPAAPAPARVTPEAPRPPAQSEVPQTPAPLPPGPEAPPVQKEALPPPQKDAPSPAVLAPQVEPREEGRLRTLARERIEGTERVLRGIDQRKLRPDRQETLGTVQNFLAKAKEAFAASDYERAFNLADKAEVLAGELASASR